MRYVIILLSSIILFVSALANAAPNNISVSGTFGDANSVTISGADFETNALDYSDIIHHVNNTIDGQNPSNTDGWIFDEGSGHNPEADTSYARSGGVSLYHDGSPADGYNAVLRYNYGSGVGAGETVYITWWTRIDYTITVGEQNQWKMFRTNYMNDIQDQDTGDNNYTTQMVMFNMMDDSSGEWKNRPGPYIDSAGTDNWMNQCMTDADSTWYRHELILNTSDFGTYNGDYTMRRYTPGSSVAEASETGMMTYNNPNISPTTWQYFLWQNWIGNGLSGDAWTDDHYVQVGTQARVELCDASTWSARTECDIQEPTAWSDTSITLTVNSGGFSTSETAYVYVVNDSGEVNSSGYPVTIGTSAPVNGVCGSADGQTFESTPASNLCSAGSAGTVTLSDTTYSWDCNGLNGGTDDSCTATYSTPVTPTGVFSLSSSAYSVSGSNSYAYITINRDDDDGTATVEWSTTGNTATHGVDYYGADDVEVSFNPGVTTQQIAIELIDSGATEDRDFAFSIANANTSIGSPSTATVTIDNTGEPTPSGSSAFLSASGGAWLLSDGSPIIMSE